MKIALLGAANSVHLARIANAILAKGHEVIVISLPNHRDVNNVINANVFYLKHSGGKGYYLNVLELKKILKDESVDVLNSHYASGYGTLGRLSNFHPTILSVWGSDVYSFPNENIVKKIILKKNLLSADLLFSTSNCMAQETRKYVGNQKNITITPFGVDTNLFKPCEKDSNPNTNYTIGFLKGTNRIYGIDIFLETVKKCRTKFESQGKKLSVVICGDGDRIDEIMNIIEESELSNMVNYLGRVPHEDMPNIISMCDVICIPSLEESFGVVALETMATEVPCIASTAPGLKEVIINEVTGFIIENNSELISEKICFLANNCEFAKNMGILARKHVCEKYDFDKNIDIFLEEYSRFV